MQGALARHLDAFDGAGFGDAVDVKLPFKRRPVDDFVAVANVALEIDAPGLVSPIAVAQGTERDRHFRAPAVVVNLRLDFPGRVPVHIEAAARAAKAAGAFVGDLGVVLQSRRIGAEHEAILAVEHAVDDDAKAVGLIKWRVATTVGNDDAGGVGLEGDHTDVERLIGKANPHFGALGSRLALVRPHLAETRRRNDAIPGDVIRHIAINKRRPFQGIGHGRRRNRQRFQRLPGGSRPAQGKWQTNQNCGDQRRSIT